MRGCAQANSSVYISTYIRVTDLRFFRSHFQARGPGSEPPGPWRSRTRAQAVQDPAADHGSPMLATRSPTSCPLDRYREPIRPQLGSTWARFHSILGLPGSPIPFNNYEFPTVFQCFSYLAFFVATCTNLPDVKPSWPHLGPSWGSLEPSCDNLGAILGPSWGHLWAILGPLGPLLGPLWASSVASWPISGPS